jgi:hypothetical protein
MALLAVRQAGEAQLGKPRTMKDEATIQARLHLWLGDKTRCGHWLTPDVQRTVAVYEVDCVPCLESYALALESAEEPIHWLAVNRVREQAAKLRQRNPQDSEGGER